MGVLDEPGRGEMPPPTAEKENAMRKLLPVLLLTVAVGTMAGCDDFELDDVTINLGGLFGPDYVVYDDYYEPDYYEEVVYVEEEYFFADFGFWP